MYNEDKNQKRSLPSRIRRRLFNRWSLFAVIIILVIAAFGFGIGIRTVPSGYKGVTLSWGKITGTTDEGFHWVNWILGEDIVCVNTQIQVLVTEPESTGTTDMQEVMTEVTLNYRVEPAWAELVYREFRHEYEGRFIKGQVLDALKATTVQFTSTELLHNRPAVQSMLRETLRERLGAQHFEVIEVAITEFQFSDSFKAQLERTATKEKQVAEEQANLEIKQLQEQQRILEALASYNVTITNELASAEASKIKADMEAYVKLTLANASAEAIELLALELENNPDYLTYLAILAWNGRLPYYYGSDAPLPFIDVGESTP